MSQVHIHLLVWFFLIIIVFVDKTGHFYISLFISSIFFAQTNLVNFIVYSILLAFFIWICFFVFVVPL